MDFLLAASFARKHYSFEWCFTTTKCCSQSQVVSKPKEPLILNISPLDLSNRLQSQRLTPFSRISFTFNKSNVFFLLAFPSSSFRTPTVSQHNETFLPRSSITIDEKILKPFYELFPCFAELCIQEIAQLEIGWVKFSCCLCLGAASAALQSQKISLNRKSSIIEKNAKKRKAIFCKTYFLSATQGTAKRFSYIKATIFHSA